MVKMNKIKLLIIIACGLCFSNCSNEFDLVEPKGEIPVVYALLDAGQSYVDVRLERAFASETISAEEIAQNPDSLYYSNAVVKIIKNNTEYVLEKVDLSKLGLPKTDGAFAKSPNFIYRILASKLNLKAGDKINLEIDIQEGQKITASASVIQPVNPSRPNYGANISFSDENRDQVKWNKNDQLGGAIHTAEYRINVIEVQGGVESKKTLVWTLGKNVTGESLNLDANSFFTFMKTSLKEDISITRYIEGIDFLVYSGDKNLADFLKISQANNGITSSGEIPVYTNLSRGLGIFGSKAIMKLEGLALNPTTFDKLKNNALTKGLNFQ